MLKIFDDNTTEDICTRMEAEIAMLEAHLEELRVYGNLPEIVASMEARREAAERVKANLTRVNEEAHRIDAETATLITEKTERLKAFTQTLDDISAMLDGVMNPVILLASSDPTVGLGQSDPIESLHNALEKYLREKAIEYAAEYLESMGLDENDALYQACIDKLSTMSSLTYLFYGDNVHGYQAGSYDINDLQGAFKQAVAVALGEIYLSTKNGAARAELEQLFAQKEDVLAYIESQEPNTPLYEYNKEKVSLIDTIDPKFDNIVANFKSAYEQNREVYEDIAAEVNVPPELIAIIHYREGTSDYLNGNFDIYLHNGETLGQPTTKYPPGKEFDNFEEAAIDALKDKQNYIEKYKLTTESEDIVAIMCFAEVYNGLGYYQNEHVNPYLYSGTNLYTSGKYIEVPNESGGYKSVYDEECVDEQVGVYLLLNAIMEE